MQNKQYKTKTALFMRKLTMLNLAYAKFMCLWA